jgi:TPR repeat protein
MVNRVRADHYLMQYLEGCICRVRNGSQEDFQIIQRSAETADCVFAQVLMAYCFTEKSVIVVPNDGTAAAAMGAKSLPWLQHQSGRKFAWAQFYLGFFYENGISVDVNAIEAARLYRLAADQGYADAQNMLGLLYYVGKGVEQSYSTANRWYQMAACQGHSFSLFNLSENYQYGRGVKTDIAEAMRLVSISAHQGLSMSQHELGARYYFGDGVEQSYEEACRWFTLAATQGYASAQFSLAMCYRDGTGVSRDMAESLCWLRLSVANNCSDAQNVLGVLHITGEEEVARDHIEAAHLFQLAANQGVPKAQYNLGVCYRLGEGVPKDMEEANRWLRAAAEQGCSDAKKMLDDDRATAQNSLGSVS